jgi:uncharacterized protein (DUF1697 family)
MPAFVALLRGVNVGTARRVPMAQWREVLTGLGYRSVATLLNSGNAVFIGGKAPAAQQAAEIAAAMTQRFGIEVPVIVKTARELAGVVAGNPIQADEAAHSRLLVAFVQERKSLPALAGVAPLVKPPEQFAVGRDAAYLLCPFGIVDSKAWQALLAKGEGAVTTRNLATVLKLQQMASALDA